MVRIHSYDNIPKNFMIFFHFHVIISILEIFKNIKTTLTNQSHSRHDLAMFRLKRIGDTKVLVRSRKSKRDRRCNDQIKKAHKG